MGKFRPVAASVGGGGRARERKGNAPLLKAASWGELLDQSLNYQTSFPDRKSMIRSGEGVLRGQLKLAGLREEGKKNSEGALKRSVL